MPLFRTLSLIITMVTVGCSTATAQSADKCISIREADTIAMTIDARDGGNRISRYEPDLRQNTDRLVKDPSKIQINLNGYAFTLIPFEVCKTGVRIKYEDSSKKTVVFAPWNQDIVIEGANNKDRFVEVFVRNKGH